MKVIFSWLWSVFTHKKKPAPRRPSKITLPPLYEPPTSPTSPETPVRPDTPPDVGEEKKRIIHSIVSVFETGQVEPDYTAVVVLPDGAGITYGMHQSTDKSGSLDAILQWYIEHDGEQSEVLAGFMPRLEQNATSGADPDNLPGWVEELMEVLRIAGEDPIMQQAQDVVFDEWYWKPASAKAVDMGLKLPLSWLVVYDSTIHGSLESVRKRFPESPPADGGDEYKWVVAYLQARKSFLAEIDIGWTSYRIDAMLRLAALGNWELQTPIHIQKPKATIE